MRFLLDAGHGGMASGAVYNGVKEEDITLQVVMFASALLIQAHGHFVMLTRDKDTSMSLTERKRMINDFKPDAFVSVHCNASTGSKARGVETFYRDKNDRLLARVVQSALCGALGRADRGVFQDTTYLNKHLTVLDGDSMIPCCLVEIGFLSNPSELDYITTHQQAIGESLASALHTFSLVYGGGKSCRQ